MARVYCAGPLFNEPERREMQEIAAQLERDTKPSFRNATMRAINWSMS